MTLSADLPAADVDSYRTSFRCWLDAHRPQLADMSASHEDHIAAGLALSRSLWEAGWKRFGWPESLGGLGGGPRFRATYYDEVSRAGFDIPDTDLSIEVIAPALLWYSPARWPRPTSLGSWPVRRRGRRRSPSPTQGATSLPCGPVVSSTMTESSSTARRYGRATGIVRHDLSCWCARAQPRAGIVGWLPCWSMPTRRGTDPPSPDVRQRPAGDVRDLLPGGTRPAPIE